MFDFFQSLIEDASLDEDARERVIELINNRNYFGVEEYLDSILVKRSSKEAFAALGEMVGGVEILSQAKDLAPNSAGIMAIRRLAGNITKPIVALMRWHRNWQRVIWMYRSTFLRRMRLENLQIPSRRP